MMHEVIVMKEVCRLDNLLEWFQWRIGPRKFRNTACLKGERIYTPQMVSENLQRLKPKVIEGTYRNQLRE